jgi:L-ascorbate metabolism protein UlaG (beta-lactamase superfamily)
MLVQEGDLRILIDPGNYSTEQEKAKNIDVILISHEHADHLDIPSFKTLIANNSHAKIYSNPSVVALLGKEGINAETVEAGKTITEKGVAIEVFGRDHAIMHSSIPPVRNVGYFIAGRLFYPGDVFTLPGKSVEILALPITAPWSKIGEVVDYALAVHPKLCFPVHDGNLKNTGATYRTPTQILEPQGIKFTVLELGKEYEF